MDWAHDMGAGVITHWFQPMAANGLRHGLTGQVQNAMFVFNKDGTPEWELEGKTLLKGETDGSSFPNGGMRATHTAGGYTILDPSSPIFLRGDTVFVPTLFVSFYGDALDEKTPLLRAMQAVSNQATRLLKLMDYNVTKVQPNIGLEQEFFLVPRTEYYRRPDLQFTGRTILGKNAPRGQELCDHYMAAINPIAMACMQEIQHECFMMGIPLKTRHREVAPNQYEFAPFFGTATTQIDQNLMVMQISEEVAARHGLACLNHEKPFKDVNGSGKHNNISLGTNTGVNLLNPAQLLKASGKVDIFPVIMAAMVRSVDLHGDLMRMAIASPGNDFRLGACEAPPAIISTYLGDDVTAYLKDFMETKVAKEYIANSKTIDLGINDIAPFTMPAEDRNRTSPFPFGGHRFEFRAVGSSQNVSMVNTVLCSIWAESFGYLANQIEAGKTPSEAAAQVLEDHWRVIFNGNGYDPAWPTEAGERGIWRIDSGVDAMLRLSAPKNVSDAVSSVIDSLVACTYYPSSRASSPLTTTLYFCSPPAGRTLREAGRAQPEGVRGAHRGDAQPVRGHRRDGGAHDGGHDQPAHRARHVERRAGCGVRTRPQGGRRQGRGRPAQAARHGRPRRQGAARARAAARDDGGGARCLRQGRGRVPRRAVDPLHVQGAPLPRHAPGRRGAPRRLE